MTKFYSLHQVRMILKLALPIIGGQLGFVLMGFFDTLQVGQLGASTLAAIGLANTVYFIANLLGIGILMGISPLVSESYGQHDLNRVKQILKNTFPLVAILSVVFVAVMWWVIANIRWLQQAPEIESLAAQYLTIVTYSTPAMLMFYALKQVLDGGGNTLPGMIITVLGLLLNIFLNWLLINGYGGFPALGMNGAAIATSISRYVMMLLLLLYFFRNTAFRWNELVQELKQWKDFAGLRVLFQLGFPIGLTMLFEMASFGIAHIMTGWIGATALAAHQVAINLASITFMVASGFAGAGSIAVGFAYGERNEEMIRSQTKTTFLIVVFFQLMFSVIFLAFSSQLAGLYTSDVRVIELASGLILLGAVFQLSDGLQATASGLLRGIQEVVVPSLLAFAAYWVLMVPACYLLAFRFNYGIYGIWMGFLIGLSGAATVLILRLKWKLKAPLKQNIEEKPRD